MKNKHLLRSAAVRQRGLSLVVILLLLVIVSMLGVASMQVVMMTERGARNDRDLQLAWQSAEAALVDAELDLTGPNASANSRVAQIKANPQAPSDGCTSTGTWRGFCSEISGAKPSWLAADLLDNNGPAVPLGTFTGRSFKAAGSGSGLGTQPALAPRYLVEFLQDGLGEHRRQRGSGYNSAAPAGSSANEGSLYRITAIGFGPRQESQAVLQTIYRN